MQVLRGDDWHRVLALLVHDASHEILTCRHDATWWPASQPTADVRVRRRTLTTRHDDAMPRDSDDGAETRVHPSLPLSAYVFDRHVVALPADAEAPAREEWVVFDSPALGQALGRLFDTWWTASTAIAATDSLRSTGAEEADFEVADLLAAGYKDEAIARQLQVSVATVRRRIQRLNAHLNATTRFQAGMAYARRRDA